MASTRIRLSPRISVNKLGEYMVADPGRRKTIVKEQKRPAVYMVKHYEDASRPLAGFYSGGSALTIKRQIERLSKRVPRNDHDQRRLADCMDALEAFLELEPKLDLSGYSWRSGLQRTPPLTIAGVAISVRPELFLYQRDQLVGAVKFHLSKSHPLDERSSDYIATTVHQYLQEVHGAFGAIARDTFVVDVLQREVRVGPRAIVDRRRKVTAACEEIYSRWEIE